ncbi:hypothetical protein V8C26DRAFT_397861 [Trichoderma gracile]
MSTQCSPPPLSPRDIQGQPRLSVYPRSRNFPLHHYSPPMVCLTTPLAFVLLFPFSGLG